MKKLILKYCLPVTSLFILALSAVFTGCSKSQSGYGSGGGSGTAATTIKLTDGAIDDASVTGAFVTITDIKLDGQSVQGFSKTTVDLHAFQNGATQTIGTFNLAAKTYSTVTFVLDFDMDAAGNAPGCYVVTTGGVKSKLQSTANSFTVSKSISLVAGSSYSLVADFDLRKMIIHQTGADHYDFATAAELASSVRIVTESNTGTISGTLTDAVSGSQKTIVYVYAKGTFDRTKEMQGQGASSIQFMNAVSSAVVNSATGSYQLHFLESGNYELHFASYKDVNLNGEFVLQGTMVVTSVTDLLNIGLSANTTLTVNAVVTAVLP